MDLVVDDNELLRLYAGGPLGRPRVEVVEAESAEAALKVMQTHDGVRLLFTDIQMPGGRDGLDWRAKSMRVGRTSCSSDQTKRLASTFPTTVDL